jgi:hypothetical protein
MLLWPLHVVMLDISGFELMSTQALEQPLAGQLDGFDAHVHDASTVCSVVQYRPAYEEYSVQRSTIPTTMLNECADCLPLNIQSLQDCVVHKCVTPHGSGTSR